MITPEPRIPTRTLNPRVRPELLNLNVYIRPKNLQDDELLSMTAEWRVLIDLHGSGRLRANFCQAIVPKHLCGITLRPENKKVNDQKRVTFSRLEGESRRKISHWLGFVLARRGRNYIWPEALRTVAPLVRPLFICMIFTQVYTDMGLVTLEKKRK